MVGFDFSHNAFAKAFFIKDFPKIDIIIFKLSKGSENRVKT